MATNRTSTQRLATLLLGQDVVEWVRERRGHRYSPTWQAIADELSEATGGQVSVTREALRLWVNEDASQKAAS